MKKWLTLVAAFAMAVSFIGCDFSDSEDDVYEDDTLVENDTFVEEDNFTNYDELSGYCTAGQSAGYFYVLIEDDLNGTASDPTNSNCTAGNPGADIDAICLWRDDSLVACGATVEYLPWSDATCNNDKDDPNTVLGEPDGVAADGVFQGYFSLNGGSIIVGLDDSAEILCGDQIQIVEMYNPDSATATIEDYKMSLGASSEGPWTIESDYVTGEALIDVSWEW